MDPRAASTDADARLALGVDIGGTNCRVGVVDGRGRILQFVQFATPASGDPDALARELRDCAAQVTGGRRLIPRAGVAIPGIWDRTTTVMQQALNLRRLEGVNLRELFEQALGRPVVLETDVNAAGWAQWLALSPRPGRFVYLSVGTGVGGCVILDGQIVRHTRGGPGHLGHLIVDTSPDAPTCRCGARGCLEAIAGGPALNRPLYAEFHESRRSGSLPDADVYARAAQALALGALQIANIYAPDMIALGGGVIEGGPGLVTQAAQAFATLGCTLPPALRIEHAPLLAEEAGVIGAALLASGASD